MKPRLLGLLLAAASCNYDAAFERYCANNPQCWKDAAASETSPDDANAQGEARDQADAGKRIFIAPPRSCGLGRPCGSDEICHPSGQVCMRMCNEPSDCPPYLDTCTESLDASSSSGRTPKVCTCSSMHVCFDNGGEFTCSPFDNLCERACFGPRDCSSFDPPRVCDKMRGWCVMCIGNRDCHSALQPHCDLFSARCTACIASDDCANRPDGLNICGPDGACIAP